ncbi:MAG TPA: YqaJ viral recombinase family protein [Halanaerobiales bacterium]|nr:YqaJ viral recombinase family protein [Halanaerobiales bacterium]
MQAKKLFNTKNMTDQEWLEKRNSLGIGGSDVSAITGINPFKSAVEVWLDKTGRSNEKEDNNAMYWGRELEDKVADEFAKRRSRELDQEVKVWKENHILQHPKYEFMIADIDRRVVGEKALLECKTTVDFNKLWSEKEFPDMYMLQVQHYLAVTGYKKAYLAVLIMNRRKFYYYTIKRDEELIDLIIENEKDFWNNYVKKDVPPEVDGSKASSRLLKRMYPDADSSKKIDFEKEDLDLIEKRNEYHEIEKKYKKKRKKCENKIKNKLQEAEAGVYQGEEVVKWKNISSRRVKTKKFREDHPELYNEYSYQSNYRRLYI